MTNGRTLYELTNGVEDIVASAPMGTGTHERGGEIFGREFGRRASHGG